MSPTRCVAAHHTIITPACVLPAPMALPHTRLTSMWNTELDSTALSCKQRRPLLKTLCPQKIEPTSTLPQKGQLYQHRLRKCSLCSLEGTACTLRYATSPALPFGVHEPCSKSTPQHPSPAGSTRGPPPANCKRNTEHVPELNRNARVRYTSGRPCPGSQTLENSGPRCYSSRDRCTRAPANACRLHGCHTNCCNMTPTAVQTPSAVPKAAPRDTAAAAQAAAHNTNT